MLADEVDTDEVEGEESAARRHQLVETDLVNEVSSQKLGHGVDHSTARCDTLDICPTDSSSTHLTLPAIAIIWSLLLCVKANVFQWLSTPPTTVT